MILGTTNQNGGFPGFSGKDQSSTRGLTTSLFSTEMLSLLSEARQSGQRDRQKG